MGLNSHLLTITEPTIKLEEIIAPDLGESDDGDHHSAELGGMVPLIKINGFTFQESDIDSFVLKLTGKYPEITATITDTRDVFTVAQYPRDGDVLSLRITMDFSETYKDIRMDFHILEFTGFSVSTDEKQQGGGSYKVRAIAKLPGFYTDVCKSYGQGNSYDHIIKIAEDLKLGVATNIDATNDTMNRICAFQTKFELLEQTVLHSYISDDTFQTYAIDPYYYVNFVDVQKIFDAEEEIEMDELISANNFRERKNDPEEGAASEKAQLILTNHHNMEETDKFISKFNLVNNSSRVAIENGYKRTLQYYDMNEEGGKLLEFDVESLVSSTIKDNEAPLKGNQTTKEDEYPDEGGTGHIKHKFIGLQHSADNVHVNWAYSAINNIQNMAELDKMKLVVELSSTNPAIYRFMKIPVSIWNYSATSITVSEVENEKAKEGGFATKEEELNAAAGDSKQDAKDPEQHEETFKVDEFLTGYYVVMGLEYVYDSDEGFHQKLHLSRKEWPVRQETIEKTIEKKEKKKGKLGALIGRS